MQLLAITIAVYIVQLVFEGATQFLTLPADWYRRPWEAYHLLTYGFAHDPEAIEHVLFNMLMLGIFGRQVEQVYGRRAFLTFYLAAIVVGGLIWSLAESIHGFAELDGRAPVLLGASAATVGVAILFALNFPKQEIRLYFLFPVPAWVFALILVAGDVIGAIQRSDNVAFTAHLGGAAFAFAFYRFDWLRNLGAGSWGQFVRNRTRPRLKVLAPEDDGDEADDLGAKVDKILAKIKAQGQDSLTRGERKILEQASRHYQQKRK
jgi:membrane associated rhomboid family serine protease